MKIDLIVLTQTVAQQSTPLNQLSSVDLSEQQHHVANVETTIRCIQKVFITHLHRTGMIGCSIKGSAKYIAVL